MNPTLLLLLYAALVVLASVLGGLVPLVVRLTHRRLQAFLSLATGFMLGAAVLLMLPHALEAVPVQTAMTMLLVGFLFMFFVERFLSFHSHEVAELSEDGDVVTAPEAMAGHSHGQACRHTTAHHMAGDTAGAPLSWVGAAAGMTLHSLVDGVTLAAAVAAGARHGVGTAAFAGFAVFVAVLLHKPFDAMTVMSLSAARGHGRTKRHLINLALALTVPLGALLFHLGMTEPVLGQDPHHSPLLGHALAFGAGTFLCIALSDLLPELQFHQHDRVKLSGLLLLGVVTAGGVAHFEHSLHDHGGHGHGDHEGHGHDGPGDDHRGHDHADHADHGDHGDHDHHDH